MIYMYLVGTLLVLLQVLDGWTTYKCLQFPENREANAALAWLMRTIGVVPALCVFKGAAVGLLLLLIYVTKEGAVGVPLAVITALTALYAAVVRNNYKRYKASVRNKIMSRL